MNQRAMKALIVCSALAALGGGVPFALGTDPVHASTIRILHGVGVLGFLGSLVCLFNLVGVTSDGEAVTSTLSTAPRTLENDVLGAGAGSIPIERRIDAAAEASKQYGRTLGVIEYNLDIYKQVARAEGPAAAEAMMDEIVATLGPKLRNTDRVERLGKGRFIAVIVLLPEKSVLDSICKRMEGSLRELQAKYAGAAGAVDIGMSIYPMGGYTGEDLIATATRHCEEARVARQRSNAGRRRTVAGSDDRQMRAAG